MRDLALTIALLSFGFAFLIIGILESDILLIGLGLWLVAVLTLVQSYFIIRRKK